MTLTLIVFAVMFLISTALRPRAVGDREFVALLKPYRRAIQAGTLSEIDPCPEEIVPTPRSSDMVLEQRVRELEGK